MLPHPHSATDTIVALATPPGRSAIGLVRISGSSVKALVVGIFAGSPTLPRRVFHADYRSRDGRVLDDVVYAYFQAPNSYTGDDVLEISSHGNPFIINCIIEDLVARGCRFAEPGEFTQRAFLNGQIDLSQAEAVMDLIGATNERALVAANRQLRGALGELIRPMHTALLRVIAQVEAYIDFPEEDLPPENRTALTDEITKLQTQVARMLATQRYGNFIREGFKVVLVGAPNAGKSSLLNALLGWERAIVSPIPGTTRDYLEERLVLGPHCIRLIDTAGLNPAPEEIERLGIEQTHRISEQADLHLIVIDGSNPLPQLHDIKHLIADTTKSIVVLTKSDIKSVLKEDFAKIIQSKEVLHVSSKTGAGIQELADAIKLSLDRLLGNLDSDLIPVNARHAANLDLVQRSLESAQIKIANGEADELLAADLRSACDGLGEIGGKIDNEQILTELFKSFCIGK